MGVDDIDFYTRTYEGSGITLNGAEGVPKKQKPLGTIYFLPGLSGTWEDYTPLLVPLAKCFRICTYDQRGHRDSPGKFDIEKCTDDLEHIISSEGTRPAGIIGHSISCREAVEVAKRFEKSKNPLQGVYMIEPCLGVDFLNWPQKAATHFAYGLTPALRFIDDAVNGLKKLREINGLSNRDVIAGYGSLARMNSSDCAGLQTPVGFMLSDSDGTLGTNNKRHFDTCIKRLNELFFTDRIGFPWYRSESAFVNGLNHCLNFKGHRPFLKKETYKDKGIIPFAVGAFFYEVFSEKH